MNGILCKTSILTLILLSTSISLSQYRALTMNILYLTEASFAEKVKTRQAQKTEVLSFQAWMKCTICTLMIAHDLWLCRF
ncbi:unnamed protein product [Periconia digitata]|uniref:Secreted protein n=1 Tax=Periconia digitata TaxID=1303443 RepID=A0A9W4UT72_9PLEO|nr:unnamed protein product [Periconia digitata]